MYYASSMTHCWCRTLTPTEWPTTLAEKYLCDIVALELNEWWKMRVHTQFSWGSRDLLTNARKTTSGYGMITWIIIIESILASSDLASINAAVYMAELKAMEDGKRSIVRWKFHVHFSPCHLFLVCSTGRANGLYVYLCYLPWFTQ